MSAPRGSELSRQEFWDDRYSKNAALDSPGALANADHEWFRNFNDLRAFLIEQLPSPVLPGCLILHLGSGTSTLPANLSHEGYKRQICVDFSPVAISEMSSLYKHLQELEWRVMDVRSMSFPTATFDVAIDKGTLDAMLYGSLWQLEEEVQVNTKAYVDEVARVLKPGGKWLYITYRQPHFLKPILAREEIWNLSVETLTPEGGGAFEYFAFVMTKHTEVRQVADQTDKSSG